MKVKVLPHGTLPWKQHSGDACYDVFSPGRYRLTPGESRRIKLGICIQIEQDEVCIVSERSSQAMKFGVHSIGNIIDSNYRGEISCVLVNNGFEIYDINEGDRICQLLVVKLGSRDLVPVDELDDSDRGESGFGSTGK